MQIDVESLDPAAFERFVFTFDYEGVNVISQRFAAAFEGGDNFGEEF